MNMFIHGRLRHCLQEEAPADGGHGDGAPPAEAAPATPDAAPPAADAPPTNVEASSLLGEVKDDVPPSEEKPKDDNSEKPKDDADKDLEGAPDAYEEFKAPDGIELDAEVMPEIHEIFKDLGLSQDKAQEVFSKFLDIQQKLAGTPEQQMAAAEQQIVALNTKLAEECKNLPDIGGEKFGESLAMASKVMQQFGSPEFRSLIAYTGVGSHPEFFKMMVAIGSKMSPDNFVQGGEGAVTERRGEDIMFGHLFKKP
jgi:hypothetical protein